MRTGKGWPQGLRRKWKKKPMRGKASEPETREPRASISSQYLIEDISKEYAEALRRLADE